jgi:methionyl-tRNA formyltransferase
VTERPPGGPPVRTVFFGSGAFAVPILDAVVTSPEVELIGVVSAPDRPVGRRGTLTPVPVSSRARALGLPLLQPTRLRDRSAIDDVLALDPGLGIAADYGRIVPAQLVNAPRHGILNVHPSLLPRHRGATPIPATILAGDTTTGVTVIRMDEGLDTGPIVAVDEWQLDGTETAPELEKRAAMVGAALLRRALRQWLAGEIQPRPQDDSRATSTRPLRREDGRLDPRRTVGELERQVRALQPWPGSWIETVAGRVVIVRAEAIPGWTGGNDERPGKFGRFGLYAADGYLALREVHPAGGRRMTFDELVRGRPQIVGSEAIAVAERA